jgi:hypothetical protein
MCSQWQAFVQVLFRHYLALELPVELTFVLFKAFPQHTLWLPRDILDTMVWLLLKGKHSENSIESSQQLDKQFKQIHDICCLIEMLEPGNTSSQQEMLVKDNLFASLFSVYCILCCLADASRCSTDPGIWAKQHEQCHLQISDCHQKRYSTLSCKYVHTRLQQLASWTSRSNILIDMHAINLYGDVSHASLIRWLSGCRKLLDGALLVNLPESRQHKCGGVFSEQTTILSGLCSGGTRARRFIGILVVPKFSAGLGASRS